MLPIVVSDQLTELKDVCLRHGVRFLAVFGSAAKATFVLGKSDIDFLVEFRPMSPAARADSYFGLLQDLERLFGVGVDLVERDAIRNPYFQQAVEESKVELYAAA